MKIAICGSGSASKKTVSEMAFKIGGELAKKECLVMTGAGTGYPYHAARGAFTAGGKVIGVSPARNKGEHVMVYKFPTDAFTKIEYTGMGIPARNFPLVKEADAIIIIGGQTGTLNEFTIAFNDAKPIGVLIGSGGITKLLDDITYVCNKKNERAMVEYSRKPEELVRNLMQRVHYKVY